MNGEFSNHSSIINSLIHILLEGLSMKKLFGFALFALLVVGCDKSNPTNTTTFSTTTSATVAFSETSMLKMAVETVDGLVITTKDDSVCHDSLRNSYLLDSLKIHLGLTAEQFDSVKVYGTVLFATLKDIRHQVKDTLITKMQARELVKAARDLFIASVQSILTIDQLVIFDAWVIRFWDKAGHRGGHGRHGEHGEHNEHGEHGRPGGHH